ncbi:hypothetical protein VTG60DRAFT_4385 [Thermothelomyces hinnuleus]
MHLLCNPYRKTAGNARLTFDAAAPCTSPCGSVSYSAPSLVQKGSSTLEGELEKKYMELLKEYDKKCAECEYQKHLTKVLGEQHRKADQELNRLRADTDSAPFAFVVIDGDGAVFREDLIALGEEGGGKAAHELNKQLKAYFHDNSSFSNIDSIFVHVVLNVKDLSRALHDSGVLPVKDHAALTKFARGFCRAQPLFTFTDVGHGKEQADHKAAESRPGAQQTSYATVGQAGAPPVINIASQRRPASPRPYYQLNKNDERVDVPLARPDPQMVQSLEDRKHINGGMNLCNRYHLTGHCDLPNCRHYHGERLNSAEALALRHKVRKTRCNSGRRCRDVSCIYGHHCPNPGSCRYDIDCRFFETHGMDLTPTIKVYEDGKREVIH